MGLLSNFRRSTKTKLELPLPPPEMQAMRWILNKTIPTQTQVTNQLDNVNSTEVVRVSLTVADTTHQMVELMNKREDKLGGVVLKTNITNTWMNKKKEKEEVVI